MKKYLTYLSFLMISLFGTDLTDFALGVWILDQPGATVSSYSLIWFFEAVPGILLAPFIGTIIDRYSKKKMIIWGQVVAGIGSISLMILFHLSMLQSWHIMIVAGIGSVASMFVYDAFHASTSTLVSKDKLVKANGLTSSIYGAVQMGTPIIAPVLYKLLGLDSIFLIDVVTFSISVIAFLFLGFVVVATTSKKFNIKEDFLVVRNFMKEKVGFKNFVFFYFLMSFLVGFMSVLFTPLVLDFSNEYVLGIVMSVAGLGALLGGVLVSLIKDIKRPMNAVLNLSFLKSVLFFCIALYISQYSLAIGGALLMTLFAVEMVISDSFLMTLIPVEKLGRIMGSISLLVGIAGPISYLLAGPFVDLIKLVIDNYYPSMYNYYPGTNLTAAIAVVFGFCGLSLLLISLVYKARGTFNHLDGLYIEELEVVKNDKEKLKLKEDIVRELQES